jgi:phosphomannomutase
MAAPLVPAPLIPLNERPIKNTIYLFDVDGTLSPSREVSESACCPINLLFSLWHGPIDDSPSLTLFQPASPEMIQVLAAIRQKVAIGFVGGSDLSKQEEQLGTTTRPVTSMFDFCFPENGLTAYRLGVQLPSESFINWLGEEKYKRLIKFCLLYIADLVDELPIVRGTFVEFRNGMVNISPVGRNASIKERNEFEAYDKTHGVRVKMIEALRKEFPDLGLTYSIGGKISFDVFPHGWDKTYCLQHVEAEAKRPDGVKYDHIHFFGDKTVKGGNDYELAQDPRTIAHPIDNPGETLAELKKIFNL